MTAAFGADYFEDRARFRALVVPAGFEHDALPIRALGPGGETLTLDIARRGAPRARRALVVLSGMHGVEGPAGSALQRQWLEHDLANYRLPEDAAVWLLHAINPFGYAWHRRWNEDNVDLNRNFVDFEAPLPTRADYASLDSWLNPLELGDPVAFLERGRALVAERGLPWLHRTLIEGQYDFPRGLYYAGRAPVESNALLRELFREILTDSDSALVVDLHTGMGDYGDCLYLPGHDRGTPAFEWLKLHFNGQRVVAPTADDSSPAVPVAGQLSRWLSERYAQLKYLTVEFGTVGGERMIASERAENWLFHHGDRTVPEAAAIIREVRETSAPSDARWRRRVLVQGAGVLADAYRAVFGAPKLKR